MYPTVFDSITILVRTSVHRPHCNAITIYEIYYTMRAELMIALVTLIFIQYDRVIISENARNKQNMCFTRHRIGSYYLLISVTHNGEFFQTNKNVVTYHMI